MADIDVLSARTTTHKAGLWVLMGSGFAASSVNGFFFGHLEMETAVAVGIACGVIGGALFASGRAPIVAGIVCGVLCALGGLVATFYWSRGREHMHSLELALSWLAGAVPGAMLFKVWALSRADEEAPPGDIPPPTIG